LVSAITHTPASGPFGPVTTPPMSSPSMATACAACWACAGTVGTPRNAASAMAATLKYKSFRVMKDLPWMWSAAVGPASTRSCLVGPECAPSGRLPARGRGAAPVGARLLHAHGDAGLVAAEHYIAPFGLNAWNTRMARGLDHIVHA